MLRSLFCMSNLGLLFSTGLAALVCSMVAVLVEGAGLFVGGRTGVLGWVVSRKYFLRVVYLGVGPGLIGHTGFNTCLRHVPALVVALSLNLEPVVGGLIGELCAYFCYPVTASLVALFAFRELSCCSTTSLPWYFRCI